MSHTNLESPPLPPLTSYKTHLPAGPPHWPLPTPPPTPRMQQFYYSFMMPQQIAGRPIYPGPPGHPPYPSSQQLTPTPSPSSGVATPMKRRADATEWNSGLVKRVCLDQHFPGQMAPMAQMSPMPQTLAMATMPGYAKMHHSFAIPQAVAPHHHHQPQPQLLQHLQHQHQFDWQQDGVLDNIPRTSSFPITPTPGFGRVHFVAPVWSTDNAEPQRQSPSAPVSPKHVPATALPLPPLETPPDIGVSGESTSSDPQPQGSRQHSVQQNDGEIPAFILTEFEDHLEGAAPTDGHGDAPLEMSSNHPSANPASPPRDEFTLMMPHISAYAVSEPLMLSPHPLLDGDSGSPRNITEVDVEACKETEKEPQAATTQTPVALATPPSTPHKKQQTPVRDTAKLGVPSLLLEKQQASMAEIGLVTPPLAGTTLQDQVHSKAVGNAQEGQMASDRPTSSAEGDALSSLTHGPTTPRMQPSAPAHGRTTALSTTPAQHKPHLDPKAPSTPFRQSATSQPMKTTASLFSLRPSPSVPVPSNTTLSTLALSNSELSTPVPSTPVSSTLVPSVPVISTPIPSAPIPPTPALSAPTPASTLTPTQEPRADSALTVAKKKKVCMLCLQKRQMAAMQKMQAMGAPPALQARLSTAAELSQTGSGLGKDSSKTQTQQRKVTTSTVPPTLAPPVAPAAAPAKTTPKQAPKQQQTPAHSTNPPSSASTSAGPSPHLTALVAEKCLATFPFKDFAKLHNKPVQKVREVFETVVQVPLLRNAIDKRRTTPLGAQLVKEYQGAKKALGAEATAEQVALHLGPASQGN